ncbi:MAG: hypothetical protein ACPGNV_05610 [Mangrovicoccus sp.]
MRKFWLSIALCGAGFGAKADLPDGRYVVHLTTQSEAEISVADIEVAQGAYSLAWREEKFEDAFLSMRPFRCLFEPEVTLCRVEYPYENKREISGGSFTDLEYDLLFVWKAPGTYGIDLWNGWYFQLTPEGAGLYGALQELDLGLLAVPPEPGNLRPIKAKDLHPAEADGHWITGLKITPQ